MLRRLRRVQQPDMGLSHIIVAVAGAAMAFYALYAKAKADKKLEKIEVREPGTRRRRN